MDLGKHSSPWVQPGDLRGVKLDHQTHKRPPIVAGLCRDPNFFQDAFKGLSAVTGHHEFNGDFRRPLRRPDMLNIMVSDLQL